MFSAAPLVIFCSGNCGVPRLVVIHKTLLTAFFLCAGQPCCKENMTGAYELRTHVGTYLGRGSEDSISITTTSVVSVVSADFLLQQK